MADYRITTPDGKVFNVTAPDTATQDEVMAHVQASQKQAVANPAGTAPVPAGVGALDIFRQAGGIIDPMGEYVAATLGGERPRLEGFSTAARLAPSLIPSPLLSGAASAGGEAVAQSAENAMGTRQGFDPVQIGLAGAIPPVMAGAARVVRGVGRTATRLMPGLFQSTQEKAIKAATDVVDELRPSENASALFRAARAQGSDSIPATNLIDKLNDIDMSIPTSPDSPALGLVRAKITKLRDVLGGSTEIPLSELLRQRRDLSELLARPGAAGELSAIYGGILADLGEAAKQGGAGAAAAKQALDVFKKDLGATKFKVLIDQSIQPTTLGNIPALNVRRLSIAVSKNREELTKLMGPEGMKVVDSFITKFGSLPPTHAATAANVLISSVTGGVGMLGGGPGGAAVAAGGQELLRNAFAVGKNPAMLNRFMNILAQSARTVVTMGQPIKDRMQELGQEAARKAGDLLQ